MLGLMGGKRTGITRLYGVREIVTRISLLTAADPAPRVWGRMGGDALDLCSLARQPRPGAARTGNRALALLVVAGISAVDLACARRIRPRTPLAGI